MILRWSRVGLVGEDLVDIDITIDWLLRTNE